jgi:hypothetical protein
LRCGPEHLEHVAELRRRWPDALLVHLHQQQEELAEALGAESVRQRGQFVEGLNTARVLKYWQWRTVEATDRFIEATEDDPLVLLIDADDWHRDPTAVLDTIVEAQTGLS